jgi:diguanylate cyclase (GGDEF)-like protein
MSGPPSILAAAVEADLEALIALNHSVCLWLDSAGRIRRVVGQWPSTALPKVPRAGQSLSEFLPRAALTALAVAMQSGSAVPVDFLANGRRLEILGCKLAGARQLLQLKELPASTDQQALFTARLVEEVERAARRADPVSVLRLELHDLGAYREQYGAAATDTVLGTVDRSLRRDARAGDFLAQWNRCGFAMLLPNTDRAAARLVAERHQRGVGSISWPHDDLGVRVGLATLWRDATDPIDLLHKSSPVQ